MIFIEVEDLGGPPVPRQRAEIVERKGLGHPDTICDSIAEAISRELCRAYLDLAGGILHHNVDKALLVAGSCRPAFGGGAMDAPLRLIVGDRATMEWEGESVPAAEIAEATARNWFRENIRHLDEHSHLLFESVLRPGSPQLTDLFAREVIGANDTSVGSGYAPLSETESLVLAAERHANSAAFRRLFPETGEDVKVMGVRHGQRLQLTMSIAFVDRHVPTEAAYFERKEQVRREIETFLDAHVDGLDELRVTVNALDQPGRGAAGAYLTVLGTSADGADGGQVGRGNRVNGLIPFMRPVSLEATAGKNPVSHVGKIYNLLARQVAERIHHDVDAVDEASVRICSRIGHPIERPWTVSTQLALGAGAALPDVDAAVRAVIHDELEGIGAFVTDLVRTGRPVC